jgi:8-oxo-dGTP diphosphatase
MHSSTDQTATEQPEILARGPWELDRIRARWREEEFEPSPAQSQAADRAILGLRERGSPSHDGFAARLVDFRADDGGLAIELQPMRWALRLVPGDAAHSVAALCVTRAADGRWLAGRRAPWVASWAGRWALGAGGSVEVVEDPVETLTRELDEEWSVAPERLSVEALVSLPNRLAMLVGLAWLPDGAEVTADAEHDEHAWWPADPGAWPEDADPALRQMASILA